MTATMNGIPVHLSPILPDGQMVLSCDVGPYDNEAPIVWIGAAPLDTIPAAGREARLTVRRGLADVLAWLGQAVENEPTGAEIWRALMNRRPQ